MIIEDSENKKKIMNAMNDEHTLHILNATKSKAKSVSDLQLILSIPMTSTYRKINSLLNAGLLMSESSIVTETGARFHLYRSTVQDISINYGDNELVVEVLPNQDMINKFMRLWRTLGGKQK